MTSTDEGQPMVLAHRYRLDERIGAGSMGTVWRATDELLGRTVAVKQLLLQPGSPGFDPRDGAYDEARERILREGRLAARLQHAHTIAVFDVVLHEDAPWLVMEYLPSRTLGALVDAEGPLDPLEAAEIGRQIADGLAAAHAAGIVHRDIKPGNVLIGADGVVKITDFGVSRAADDVQLTRTGLIAGTPAFLAPEIARGDTPTPAADVFALGSTLYAAVEGEPPFGLDDNAYALLYKVSTGNIQPPERSGRLTPVLMHMLRAEPAERPTARRARDELAALIAGDAMPTLLAPRVVEQPPPTEQPRPAERPRPSPRRRSAVSVGTRVDTAALPATVTDAPAVAPIPRPPDPRRHRFRLSTLAVVALVVLVVLGGVLAAYEFGGATAGSTSAAGAPEIPVNGRPTAGQLESFVRAYYALLPDQTRQAWAMLGPAARAASNGYDGFTRFYDSLDSVSFAAPPKAINAQTVRATLRFARKNGRVTDEPYRFTVVPGPNGRLQMSSFSPDTR
jgi:serine/threonine protein kinase